MNNNGEKRYIPGSNPDWELELPDGYSNSLVAKDGKNWDNGYNFDEKDEDDNDDEPTYDSLGREVEFDPEAAKKLKEDEGNTNLSVQDKGK